MCQPLVLAVAGLPEDMPEWLTQEYFEQCMEDAELQENWEPKPGDLYFCIDLYSVMRIETLRKYYSAGEVPPLKTDHGKDSRGHWLCDIYIPEPHTDQ